MEIKKNLVSEDKYHLKCPHPMTPEFIVVHNTYNDASARNEISYMISNNSPTSFHYAIDDKEIWQGIPENRNSWNAGDGGTGVGNRKGISIEICYSKSGGEKFDKAEKLSAKFIAYKLLEKGWDIDRVKKHQDFSGKYCPHRTLDKGWNRFLEMVRKEMINIEKELRDKPSDWAKESWEWATKEKLLDGTRPHDFVTRQEMAIILKRILERCGAWI